MVDPGNMSVRRANLARSLAALAIACLCFVGVALWYSRSPAPSDDVAEPITPIKGTHDWASDSVWLGVVFVDQKKIQREARYITTSYATEEIHDTLMLDRKTLPPRSHAERAFLALLERWYQHDAEAQEMASHLERGDFPKLTEAQQGKMNAVAIMRTLKKRN
jgi:hypothetical protein